MIKKEDKPEFIRQIMELFEDFLDEYRIKIPQKEGVDDYDPDTIRHFYKCVSSKIFYKRISFYLKILIYVSGFHYTF